MFNIFLSLFVIFVVLVISEYLWRHKRIGDELTRKVVHIFVASFVAFWPLYLSYGAIRVTSIGFLLVILGSRYLHIFNGILHVKRRTYGDIFFPIAILALAIYEPHRAVFMIALLHIGLADGFAALVGKRLGKTNKYKVFSQVKSVAGTLTFVVISLAILVAVKEIALGSTFDISWYTVISAPVILAFVENVAVFGSDDLAVPLVLAAILR